MNLVLGQTLQLLLLHDDKHHCLATEVGDLMFLVGAFREMPTVIRRNQGQIHRLEQYSLGQSRLTPTKGDRLKIVVNLVLGQIFNFFLLHDDKHYCLATEVGDLMFLVGAFREMPTVICRNQGQIHRLEKYSLGQSRLTPTKGDRLKIAVNLVLGQIFNFFYCMTDLTRFD